MSIQPLSGPGIRWCGANGDLEKAEEASKDLCQFLEAYKDVDFSSDPLDRSLVMDEGIRDFFTSRPDRQSAAVELFNSYLKPKKLDSHKEILLNLFFAVPRLFDEETNKAIWKIISQAPSVQHLDFIFCHYESLLETADDFPVFPHVQSLRVDGSWKDILAEKFPHLGKLEVNAPKQPQENWLSPLRGLETLTLSFCFNFEELGNESQLMEAFPALLSRLAPNLKRVRLVFRAYGNEHLYPHKNTVLFNAITQFEALLKEKSSNRAVLTSLDLSCYDLSDRDLGNLLEKASSEKWHLGLRPLPTLSQRVKEVAAPISSEGQVEQVVNAPPPPIDPSRLSLVKLEELHIKSRGISEEGIKWLRLLPRLNRLTLLAYMPHNRHSLHDIFQNCPRLQSLSYGPPFLICEERASLISHLNRLREFRNLTKLRFLAAYPTYKDETTGHKQELDSATLARILIDCPKLTSVSSSLPGEVFFSKTEKQLNQAISKAREVERQRQLASSSITLEKPSQ